MASSPSGTAGAANAADSSPTSLGDGPRPSAAASSSAAEAAARVQRVLADELDAAESARLGSLGYAQRSGLGVRSSHQEQPSWTEVRRNRQASDRSLRRLRLLRPPTDPRVNLPVPLTRTGSDWFGQSALEDAARSAGGADGLGTFSRFPPVTSSESAGSDLSGLELLLEGGDAARMTRAASLGRIDPPRPAAAASGTPPLSAAAAPPSALGPGTGLPVIPDAPVSDADVDLALVNLPPAVQARIRTAVNAARSLVATVDRSLGAGAPKPAPSPAQVSKLRLLTMQDDMLTERRTVFGTMAGDDDMFKADLSSSNEWIVALVLASIQSDLLAWIREFQPSPSPSAAAAAPDPPGPDPRAQEDYVFGLIRRSLLHSASVVTGQTPNSGLSATSKSQSARVDSFLSSSGCAHLNPGCRSAVDIKLLLEVFFSNVSAFIQSFFALPRIELRVAGVEQLPHGALLDLDGGTRLTLDRLRVLGAEHIAVHREDVLARSIADAGADLAIYLRALMKDITTDAGVAQLRQALDQLFGIYDSLVLHQVSELRARLAARAVRKQPSSEEVSSTHVRSVLDRLQKSLSHKARPPGSFRKGAALKRPQAQAQGSRGSQKPSGRAQQPKGRTAARGAARPAGRKNDAPPRKGRKKAGPSSGPAGGKKQPSRRKNKKEAGRRS